MELTDKNVLVVGLARSGMAAAELLVKLGAHVTVSETKPADQLKEAGALRELGVILTGQTPDVFEGDYDLCVKNPGVHFDDPKILRLKERGIPVITEIELGFCAAKPQHYAAVTGTNGKTTTTTLLYEIFERAHPGMAHACGNIGTPLCETVLKEGLLEEEGHYIALEISNYQLVDIDSFRPEAAVILNLTPDHLDVMGSVEAYYRSKTEVYRNMRDEDTFILNADDANIAEYTVKYPVRSRVQTFSLDRADTDDYVRDGWLCIGGERVLRVSDIPLPGKHNLQNVMAAAALAKAEGIPGEVIEETVKGFKGVEHRIEFVRELGGVRFYNDSKGTNTDATVTALKAFDRGVILLLGGFEKGLPMDDVKAALGCVKKVIGFGACGPRLVRDTVGGEGTVVNTLDEAVAEAVRIARSGDTVLLSPSTSSFDQYSGYEERGRHFKEIVNSLDQER